MKGLSVLAIGLLALSVAPGKAYAQASVDAASIKACYMQAAPGDDTPSCLGQASNVCQGRPGGSTTMGIAECVQAETAVWDRILNDVYKTLRAGLKRDDKDLGGGSRVEALTLAQRAWIAFRDAECNLDYLRWQDGSIRTVVAANCQMEMTARRAIQLRDKAQGN